MRFSRISLASATTYLAKNENEKPKVQPLPLLAWRESKNPHKLCPAWNLHLYKQARQKAKKDHLRVWSDTLLKCNTQQIEEATMGPGGLTNSSNSGLPANTLLRPRCLRPAIGCQPCHSQRDFALTVRDNPCVAMVTKTTLHLPWLSRLMVLTFNPFKVTKQGSVIMLVMYQKSDD